MKELELIFNELKNYFTTKSQELRENPYINAYTEGLLLNRQRDIESFERACLNTDFNPLLKNEIVANFKNDANKIKADIDAITIKDN